MPAGTWNLPKIRKTVPLRNIRNISTIDIFDTTSTSPNYFNVLDFPDRLTSGKNIIKLNAANESLVDNSEIHIEILDYNGNPIYFEPLNYLEQDGTRVIAIYVYENTSPGLATVYIAGRARVNVFEGNRPLRYTDTLNSGPDRASNSVENNRLFKDYPNLLWTRTINVAPEKRNSSEIIFTQNPRVTVVERVVNYQQPITLNNVNVATSASGATISIAPIPVQGSIIANASNINAAYSLNVPLAPMEGSTARNTPIRSAGAPVSTVGFFAGASGLSVNTSNNASIIAAVNQTIAAPAAVPASQTSQGVTLSTGFSRATFTGFELSASYEGGLLVVNNPLLSVDLGTALVGSPSQVIPAADAGDLRNYVPDSISVATDIAMSGSVVFVINDVESTTEAKVSQLAGPGHNAPQLQAFNFVAVKSQNNAQTLTQTLSSPVAYDIKSIQASANFTSSHTEPLVYSTTAQSQSFAEVVLANIEPATGDVYKIRTSYKAAGQFGDFVSAGDTILERIELLEDTGSFEGAMAIGQIYNRIGFFTDISDFNTYWETDTGDQMIGVQDLNFSNSAFMNAVMHSVPGIGYSATGSINNATAIKLKDEYLPVVEKNSRYAVRLRAKHIHLFSEVGDYTYTSGTTTSTITEPRFDIYISGSLGQGTILPVQETYNAYRMTDYDLAPTLPGRLADDGPLGKLVGTVEMNRSETGVPSITDVLFNFETTELQNVKIFIVSRRGTFAFKDISITTDAETGFSPNHMRLNIRIPSEFIDVPMIFKFEYFDYLGTRADTETTVYPIKFTGDNTVINGGDNLLSGSLFIGNTIGNGIEMAGVSSGFIRTIGYEGFLSASRTDKPGGFIMYTGSVLPESPDSYSGVGLELVADSGSFLRFATDESVSDKAAGLEVRTPRFFFGSDSQFISGANGNIEISSSDFHLTKEGSVTMTGAITAQAGGDIGGWSIGTSALSSSNNAVLLDADGPYYISSSGFQVGANGSVTASTGLIAGFEIDDHSLSTIGVEINDSTQQIFISSSAFKVDHAGNITASNVDLSGKISATSGDIGGFSIDTTTISSSNNQIILRSSGVITGSDVLFTGGKIAGWEINGTKLFSNNINGYGGFALDGNPSLPFFRFGHDANNNIAGHYFAADNFGLQGYSGGASPIFSLGDGGTVLNQIAGWTFDNEKLVGGNMIIKKEGTIESDGFASDVAGSGFRLTANQGGFLEVENAKIRGTLATAVFEKEAVNAVGGQLYVANSTTLTGSGQLVADIAGNGTHRATDTTMSVANVTGFAVDEIITAKKISNTGFATEYMLVESSSRDAGDSETDFTGKLFVRRGYSGSAPSGQTSSSLGDIASNAQSYSGSQVIVSTGKVGTGYIRLNANPNDPTTPYIDIVERTGSAIYDIDLKARLGDLSGITDSTFSDTVEGFGLYTQNGYFKGKIEVASLPKPPATEDLILYYPLQSTFLGATGIVRTADLSGNGHDSRDHANGLPDTTFISGSNSGPTGGGLAFDGNSTVVENRTINSSLTNNMDMTVAYWAKKEGEISQRCHWHMSDGGNNEVALFMESSTAPNADTSQTIRLMTNNGSEGDVIIDSGSLQLKGEWRHYAVVIPHGGVGLLYIDGVKRGTFSGTNDLSSVKDTDQLLIGADVDTDIDTRNDYFTGSMADFRIYEKALTTSEIESLYSLPTAGVGRTVIEGNRITTGQIRSSNFGASLGSELNLDEGTFKLGGADNPPFQWDGTNLNVTGSSVVLATPTFFLGGTSQFISGSDGLIEISSSNFHLDREGDVVMQGTITATAGGTIGGFTINSNDLSATNILINSATPKITLGSKSTLTDANSGLYLGTDGIALGASSVFKVTSAGSLTSTSGIIGGFGIAASTLKGGSNTVQAYIELNAQPGGGGPKIQVGGNNHTRTVINPTSVEFFSGSQAVPAAQFTSEYVPQQGFVTLAGGTVGGGGDPNNPMIGEAMWAFGGGGSPAYSGSVQLTGLFISGARYEVNPQDDNDSIIRQTQIFMEDQKNSVFGSLTPGALTLQNDSVDTDHSSGGAQVYRRTPAIQIIQNQTNTPFSGQAAAALYVQTTAGNITTMEIEDQVGTEDGTFLLDVEHTTNSTNESLTGISSGPIAQIISLEAAGATQNNEGAIGLAINMDNSYDDSVTAAIWCDNQIVTTHEVTAYYSDERLKNFEGKIENALDKVSQISGYYFRRNELANSIGYSGNKLEVGVNAQEVKKIMPEVVKKAGVKPHLQPKDEEPYMTVDYARLVPLLIESIKELKTEVDELKKKLGE